MNDADGGRPGRIYYRPPKGPPVLRDGDANVARPILWARPVEKERVFLKDADRGNMPDTDKVVPLPPRSRRPTITIRIGETERIVDEIEAALIASDRGLYRRGGLIVATGFDKMPTWDGKTVEVQIIEERDNYALLEDIEAAAEFAVFDGNAKALKRATPTMKLALTLKQRRHRLRLPNLVALINCPTIKADGQLVTEPGFDPSTGILFDPRGVAFPPVPDKPTRLMAETALATISRLVATFDFVSQDDKAVALSLIITAIVRAGLPTAPMHGFDAPVAGSGKSKLVDIACILATGHEAGVTAQGEDREEAEKRLSSLLMRGDPIIAIDNCEVPLEGVLINQALTQTRVELRILGVSKVVTARCAALLTSTGNNLIVKGDLTRRSVIGRLDPKTERPELRQFDYDPIADAKANRGELVAAALTILRAYHVAGRPNRPPRLQSFEQWSDLVRGSLIWLKAGDPVATMDRLRKRDPALASLTAVLHAWSAAFGAEPVTARKVVDAAESRATDRPPKPDLRDALIEAGVARSGKLDAKVLGNWLAKHADRVVTIGEGLLTGPVAVEAAGERQGVGLWKLSRRTVD
jgi:hypothetical protein